MASKWVKMKFLELGVNRKVVGNVPSNLYMNFQPNLATRSRENVQKPQKNLKIEVRDKNSIWGKSRFFMKNPSLPFFYPYVP